jgi:hypothetical protein
MMDKCMFFFRKYKKMSKILRGTSTSFSILFYDGECGYFIKYKNKQNTEDISKKALTTTVVKA